MVERLTQCGIVYEDNEDETGQDSKALSRQEQGPGDKDPQDGGTGEKTPCGDNG